MLFTSYNFILFLLALFVLYYITPKNTSGCFYLRQAFFYSFSGWDNVAYITVTIAATYFTAVKIGQLYEKQESYLRENKASLTREEKKAYKEKIKAYQKKYLLLCLFFDLGILAVLKYTNFMISNINSVSRLFNGREISFRHCPSDGYFFYVQAVGYLVDVYRGNTA